MHKYKVFNIREEKNKGVECKNMCTTCVTTTKKIKTYIICYENQYKHKVMAWAGKYLIKKIKKIGLEEMRQIKYKVFINI